VEERKGGLRGGEKEVGNMEGPMFGLRGKIEQEDRRFGGGLR